MNCKSRIKYPQVVFSLLSRESTAVSDQVNEADGDTSINIKDQIVLLASCDRLDGKGVVQEFVRGESLKDKLLDKLDTKIGVVSGLNLMANTRD